MKAKDPVGLTGRQGEARRNDQAVIDAAREVLVSNPSATMADVAQRAGVGQASLYRRYRTKNELLNAVCAEGMRAVCAAAEESLANGDDPWDAFAAFMFRYVDTGGPAQLRLAGHFDPDPALFALARRTHRSMQKVIARAKAAGVMRSDATGADLALMASALVDLNGGDGLRACELRHRLLVLMLDGVRAHGRTDLPGRAPGYSELERLWG